MRVISENGSMKFHGKMEIRENLPMKIEAELKLTKCNLDGSGCIHFEKLIFSKFCEKLSVKTSVAYKLTMGVHPRPTCPIAKNTYVITNDTNFPLEIFRLLPLEGFLWRMRYFIYEKKGGKRVRPLACVECETAVITKTRRTKD